jgi:hypothetical protein
MNGYEFASYARVVSSVVGFSRIDDSASFTYTASAAASVSVAGSTNTACVAPALTAVGVDAYVTLHFTRSRATIASSAPQSRSRSAGSCC